MLRDIKTLCNLAGTLIYGSIGVCLIMVESVPNIVNWQLVGTFFLIAAVKFAIGVIGD